HTSAQGTRSGRSGGPSLRGGCSAACRSRRPRCEICRVGASLAAPGEATPTALAVSAIEFGRIPIDAGDARIIFPSLPITRESVFVRLKLTQAPDRERLGASLRITLTSPLRPRLLLWLGGA